MTYINTRAEIIDVLRKQGWKVDMRTGMVVGRWRRRTVAAIFDSAGRITAASVSYPLPRNAGTYQGALTAPLKVNALRFIRGEE